MELVTIKPKAGSRKFAVEGSMKTTNEQHSEDGKVMNVKSAEFRGERFPKSSQFFRVSWGAIKQKWLLDDGDGNEMNSNSKELDELVSKTRLQYPENHRLKGEYIKSADIYDQLDPFFNHKLAYIKASEGETLLDKSKALDAIILRGLKRDPKFQTAGAINPLTSAGVRYIIVDKDIDIKIRKEIRGKKLEASKLYDALNSEKKLKIAMAMNLIPSENIGEDIVDDLLFKASEDSSKISENGMTRQELFVSFAKMKSEDLNIKHRIAKAKSLGFLKKQGDKGWLLFGSPVGKTQEQIENYITNPEHQDMLIRLEEGILKHDKSN